MRVPVSRLTSRFSRASVSRCRLHVSVEDLKRLFSDDPEKMVVGRKGEMVEEFVKMLYFQYTLETEVSKNAPCTLPGMALHPWKNQPTRIPEAVTLVPHENRRFAVSLEGLTIREFEIR